MIYLESFRFPSREKEELFLNGIFRSLRDEYYTKTCDALYPFYVLSERNFYSIDFEPITILYGGNGSGKSTALNVISNALHVKRNSLYNTTRWLNEYIGLCSFRTDESWSGEEFNFLGERQTKYDIAEISQMITSDDIFKKILESRAKNEQKVFKSNLLYREIAAVKGTNPNEKSEIAKRYQSAKSLNMGNGENVDEYKRFWGMKKKSFTNYLTEKLGPIERGFSNGESGMMYLAEMIQQEGLYLLDEPENSMSCQFQKNLAEIITFSAKNCNSQFIIATHSPFLLAILNAKIYNLDKNPVTISKFWELDNMKEYYKLFTTYSEQFKAG